MKNSDFKKGDTPPSDRPTYYSSEEDPRQTAVNDRIAQKARYGRGADSRAASHAFKEAARRMVGQGNLENILRGLDLGLPDFADLAGLSRKVLAAVISGKGHVDDEMEETVRQLEGLCEAVDWFWTDPRQLTAEDVRRFNAKFRPSDVPDSQSTEAALEAQPPETSVQAKTGTAPLVGEATPGGEAREAPAKTPQSSTLLQESLFEERPPVEHAAAANVPEARLGQKSWLSSPSKSTAVPFFSGSAGAQVVRRKSRGSKEGAIAAENLRVLLAGLQTDAGWLADRIGASGKALKLILSGKGAGDEEAVHSVEYLEYPLRGKRGWFWTELYTPTNEDLDRFNSRYSARLFQEVPGAPVRRNAAESGYGFEPVRSANVAQSGQSSEAMAETQQEPQMEPSAEEQLSATSFEHEDMSGASGHPEHEHVTDESGSQEARPEASAHEEAADEVTEAPATLEADESDPGEAHEPEASESVVSASAPVSRASTAPLNIFVVGADDEVSKAKPTPAVKSGKGVKRSAQVETAPLAHPGTPAMKAREDAPLSADQSRIQTVLGNLSRLSAVLDLGRDEFQQAVGISGEMMTQLRVGQYLPEAHQAIRRLEEGLFLMPRELEETHFDPSGFLLAGFKGRMQDLLTESGPTLVKPAIRAAEFPAPTVRASAPEPAPVPTPAPAPASTPARARPPAAKPKLAQQPTEAPKRRGRPPKVQEDKGRQELVAKNLVSLCGGGTKRFSVRAVTGIPAQRMDALLNESSPASMTREEESKIEEALFLGDGWFTATKQKAMPKAELQARVDARLKGRTYP